MKQCLIITVLLAVASMPGCATMPTAPDTSAWWHSMAPTPTLPGQVINLGALDVIAGLAALAGAILLVMWAMRLPIPPRAAAAAVITAIAAWTLKFMMIRYIWLIALAAFAALAFFAVALYKANSPEILNTIRFRRPPPTPPKP